MSIMQKVKQVFSTHAETMDSHSDEQLRSRYYKTNTQNALKAVEDVIRGLKGYTVTSVSPERGEMSVNVAGSRKAFVVVTVITIRPFETAIDFSVTTETPLPSDFGFSKKVIVELYNQLDKQLVFIGSGLGAKL
ncbi:cytosolic protein [Ectobacillus funiculus]|uniref:Cytosolic protein n=1 Tax=Ectobacillus funiculus TaxID=137993 RepID=A0ABV5WHH3_9BACI